MVNSLGSKTQLISNILFFKLKTCGSLHGCLGGIKLNTLISLLVTLFFFFHSSLNLGKGRQCQPGPFLLSPWAQWARHNGLLTS